MEKINEIIYSLVNQGIIKSDDTSLLHMERSFFVIPNFCCRSPYHRHSSNFSFI